MMGITLFIIDPQTTGNPLNRFTMSSSSNQSTKDLRSKLNYVYDDGKRPFLYARPRTKKDPHSEDYGGTDDLIETCIRDGRQHSLALDQHGFELTQHQTQLSRKDFDSDRSKVAKLFRAGRHRYASSELEK